MGKPTQDHMEGAAITPKMREFLRSDGASIQAVRLLLSYVNELEALNKQATKKHNVLAGEVHKLRDEVSELRAELDRAFNERVQKPLTTAEARELELFRKDKERQRRGKAKSKSQRKKDQRRAKARREEELKNFGSKPSPYRHGHRSR